MPKVEVTRLHTLTGHRDAVYTLAPSDEEAIFFSASGDGMVVQWDLRNPAEGQQIAQLPNSIYALHHVPGTDFLVVGHNYEGIHLLNWRERKEVASLQLTKAPIFNIQSAGEYLLVADGEGFLTIVHLPTFTIQLKLALSAERARVVAVNPARAEVAIGSSDGYIRIVDLATQQVIHAWQAHTNSVFALAYTPGHPGLLSGSRDARLKAWRADQGYAPAGEVVAHLYAINDIAFSPDGKHFVTCSMDKSIKVWQTDTLRLLKVIDKARHAGHGTSVNKVLWTFFNDQLVSASDDRTLSVWDINFLN
ncbi:MAG: WD40 repeat domain-containing protein [Cyclobacteriaceae bacterium]|jgi:WD40 repeat protein